MIYLKNFAIIIYLKNKKSSCRHKVGCRVAQKVQELGIIILIIVQHSFVHSLFNEIT